MVIFNPYSNTKPPPGSEIDWDHPLVKNTDGSKALVGCWHLNEGAGILAQDISGNNNHGTLVNGPIWSPGQAGPALAFDGTNDYISLGNANILRLLNTNFTLELLVKPIVIDATICLIGNGMNGPGWSLSFYSNNDLLFYYGGISHWRVSNSNVIPVANVWYHIVFTFQKSSYAINFYVNAKNAGENTAAAITNPSRAVIIGIDARDFDGYAFSGLFDYARIYNSILQPAEIQQLYSDPYCFIRQPRRVVYFVPSVAAIIKMLNEISSIQETQLRIGKSLRLVSEAENISESELRLGKSIRPIVETVNILETLSKIRKSIRLVSETLNIQETKIRFGKMLQTVSETLTISEIKLVVTKMVRFVTEVINIQEAKLRIKRMTQVILEVLNIQETTLRTGRTIRTIIDALNIQETKQRIFRSIRLAIESINISELEAKIAGFVRLFVETINLSETKLRILRSVRRISDTLNLTEVNTRIGRCVRLFLEALNISETKMRLSRFTRLLAETVNINEIKIFGIVKLMIVEIISLSDSLIKSTALVVQKFFIYLTSKIIRTQNLVSQTIRTQNFASRMIQTHSFTSVITKIKQLVSDIIG